MTRSFACIALALAVVIAAGCKKEEPAAPVEPVEPPAEVVDTAPPPPPPEPAVDNMGGDKERRMANCPTAVAGADVKIEDAPDGVVISVTATDPAATTEVRTRAAKLAESSKADSEVVKHTGGGTGGGAMGYCPVVLADTVVTVEEIEGGSKITVKPTDAAALDKVKEMTSARAKFAVANQNMAGGKGRQMANCPSAVEGAETKADDSDGGITLTVTSADAKAAKDIKARAKKLATAAKAPDSTGGKHSGTGTGGGEEGFCPVVLAGTTIEVKDVDGGVAITVKPANADHVDMLRMMTRERLESRGAAQPEEKRPE